MSSPGGPPQRPPPSSGDYGFPPTYRPQHLQSMPRPPLPSTAMPAPPMRPPNAPSYSAPPQGYVISQPPSSTQAGPAPPAMGSLDPSQTHRQAMPSMTTAPVGSFARPQVYRPPMMPPPSASPPPMTTDPTSVGRPPGQHSPVGGSAPFQPTTDDYRVSRRKYPEEITRAYDSQPPMNPPPQASSVYGRPSMPPSYSQPQMPPSYPSAMPQYNPNPHSSPPPPSSYAASSAPPTFITPADALGGGRGSLGLPASSMISTIPHPSAEGGTFPGAQPSVMPMSTPQAQYIDAFQQQLGGTLGSRPVASLNLLAIHLDMKDIREFPRIKLPPQLAQGLPETANCPPPYQRCTLNAIPQTSALLSKSKLPFGIIISPFRSIDRDEEPVPVSTSASIVRCRYCRTYINPFVTFAGPEARWKCNICHRNNELPSDFDYDVCTQQQVDRSQKVELTHGVVEFVASPEYMVRPPQPPVYLFLIDVSSTSVASGMLAAACHIIGESLDDIPNEDGRARIGFMTVDSTLHFYNLDPSLTQPRMLVVSDLEDVFLPQPDDLLANLTESKSSVIKLLEQLPEIFKTTQNVQNALGPALQAAQKLLVRTPKGGGSS